MPRREDGEKTPLLEGRRPSPPTPPTPPSPGSPSSPRPPPRLSALGAACCIVDLFGVFPVLALPRSLLACGWAGVPLALTVVVLQTYTGRLLGRCWLLAQEATPRWTAAHRRDPYAALADLAFGSRGRRLVSGLLHTAVFGAYVPDLLFAAENMHLIGRRLWELEDGGLSFCVWLIVLGVALCPFLCLGSPKDQKWVTATSVALVISVAGLTWSCQMHAPWSPRMFPPLTQPSLPPLTLQAAALAYGNLVFQFDAHPALLTVQVDMAEPKRLGHAITGAYTLSASLALVTTLLSGLLRPGTAGRADVLQPLPGSPPLYAAVLLATAQIMLSTIVGGSALFQDVEKRLKISPYFTWRRIVLRGSLLAVAVVLALASPRLPLAMGLLGAAVTGPLSLVLPPLLHARLLRLLRGRGQEPTAVFYSTDEDSCVEKEHGDKIDAKVLLETRRSSVEQAAAKAEATAAAEEAARQGLVNDQPYRRLADDTRLPEAPEGGCCSRLLAAADRYLHLDDPRSPSLLHTVCCVVLALVGATSSVLAFFYVARDAAFGLGAGRGPPSCLGLPF